MFFKVMKKEDTGKGLKSMETNVYHYFENEADKTPILSVEYIKTPYNTFARSFKLMKGSF